MSDLKKNLGKRIKQLRKELGFSQERLAELVNMDKPNLSNIECGKRFMTAQTLQNIASALNVPVRELFDFSFENSDEYILPDIKKILNESSLEELKFFLKVMESYKNIKK